MKKLLYTLSLALLGTLAHAQVKIGSNPGTIGSSSNLEVEATNGKKTIVDKSTGNVTVNGQVTIADGTQGAGRVFTSDANGNGSWVAGASLNVLNGSIPNQWTPLTMSTILPNFIYSGASITLNPGKWLLYFNATYMNNFNGGGGINIWWDLSTSNTSNTQDGRTLSGSAFYGNFMPVSATYAVNPTTTTTYYMWAAAGSGSSTAATSGSATYSGEGRLYAIPVAQ